MIEKRPLSGFLFLSIAVHCALLAVTSRYGTMDLSAPVAARVISVDLSGPDGEGAPAAGAHAVQKPRDLPEGDKRGGESEIGERAADEGPKGAVDDAPPPAAPVVQAKGDAPAPPAPAVAPAPAPSAPSAHLQSAKEGRELHLPPPLRQANEFLGVTRETLTYRITLHGVKVGEATLDAKNDNGAVRIVVKVASAPWVSAFYPVDDEIKTELVAGNYLVTSIRQREGKFVGNTGFTLMLREKKVFSTKALVGKDGLITEPLPRSDVTDVVSGFYYLRNQPLEVGKIVLLHLYDSGKYAPTEVEVLRRENIEVAGLGTVPTLVVLPHLKTAAIFRRTGDLFIWLTADSRRVPVRVETSIPIGAIRAELVSSEVERGTEETAQGK